ncbi:hypothetical protein PR202_ga21976 [Eleusine coracana subsp. coracana]|uniref:Uncharacterized protein n=1 Tax=Eleusine coracana subsp. coracana TaxID=191504 RepID=A0AAV5D266_ELECO|nr:hypothetical protein PR202_ga21976 [Eleusine coracana subsp. coracana]
MVSGLSPPRRTLSMGSGAMGRRAAAAVSESPKPGLSRTMGGERTVKRLRLSRALTVPEGTTVLEACRRMAARRADAALLTDSNALLCGILTDKDIATRVIARELKIDETPVWKVMTRQPVFVLSDTLAVEALQKMVQGKFRHLPVVDNGEVVAMLDIAKCLYDAIARMERVSEKGKAAIMRAADNDDKYSIVEAFKEQMFRPCLSAIANADSTLIQLLITVDNQQLMWCKLQVMTPDPECATVDMPILDALRIMQERKFLHLPVMDRGVLLIIADGSIVSILDVIDITHAAISIGNSDNEIRRLLPADGTMEQVESSSDGVGNDDAAISMIQRFWDSAMALGPLDSETDTQSQMSEATRSQIMSEVHQETASGSEASFSSSFSFKLQDRRGRMHRFGCDVQSLTPLVTCILQRLGTDIHPDRLPQILYEDEDRDKVVLATDDDLAAAVDHARMAGWKARTHDDHGLRLFLDYSGTSGRRKGVVSGGSTAVSTSSRDAWAAAYSGVAADYGLVSDDKVKDEEVPQNKRVAAAA